MKEKKKSPKENESQMVPVAIPALQTKPRLLVLVRGGGKGSRGTQRETAAVKMHPFRIMNRLKKKMNAFNCLWGPGVKKAKPGCLVLHITSGVKKQFNSPLELF